MLKTIFVTALFIVAATLLLFLVVIGRERSWELIAGSPDQGSHDFAAGERSPTRNDALACAEGLCDNPDFTIPASDDAPETTIERLAERLLSIDALARRVDDESNPSRARFVTHSPVMRFPDMIHLEAQPLPDGRTGMMAYARAQLGREDFGKNRARLEALFAADRPD